MSELLAHLRETNDRHNRVWQIHFLQTLPVYMAMSTFDDLYQDLFGTDNGLVAYRLMQGFDNKTVEMGRALWKLSRQVLGSPMLSAALAESGASNVFAALEQSNEGRAFLADFHAFLDVYGRRGEKLGVGFITWIEDPSHAIRQLQEYISQPNLDFDSEMASLATERERLVAEARVPISAYPQNLIDKFESMLDYAQQATIISEDHNYYIDFGAIYQVRQVLLEFGRRFTEAGVLDDPQDVFMLTSQELRDTATFLPHIKRQGIVAVRTAQMAHFRQVTPPALGTLPPGPPPEDPLSRTIGKFFGAPAPEPEHTDGILVIRGSSGSSGTVRGIARVVESLADAGRLMKGDILVAPTTAPAWTPLFATAGAVVTDTGGVLSHSAVVAREYRIPAVVGAGVATTVIRDGDLIEVDGDTGVVRILSDQDSDARG